MANLRIDSPLTGPGGSAVPSLAEVKAGTLVPLGSFFKREMGFYPVPGGHLTTDSAITSGIGTITGLRFVPWTQLTQDGKYTFNYQGMSVSAAPSTINSTAAAAIAGSTAMQNVTSQRNHGFGTLTGSRLNGTQNIRFRTDSLVVRPVYVFFNGYTGSNYHDMHILVEGSDGLMQHLSSGTTVGGTTLNGLPHTSSGAGGVYHRNLVFADRRMKKFRVILPGFCFFMGVYIDTNATISRTANNLLFAGAAVDSWDEPNGASWNKTGGHGSTGWAPPGGSYQCIGLSEALSFVTSCTVEPNGQGGTGWKTANTNTPGEATTYNVDGQEACAASDIRMATLVTKFASQHAIHLLPASWNDDVGAPHQDNMRIRMANGLTKLVAYSAILGQDVKFITGQVQPVDRVDGDRRDLYDAAVAEIAVLYPSNCLGYYRYRNMWLDTAYPSGPRSIYCHADPFSAYIHLWGGGFLQVADYIAEQIAPMSVPLEYAQKAMAA